MFNNPFNYDEISRLINQNKFNQENKPSPENNQNDYDKYIEFIKSQQGNQSLSPDVDLSSQIAKAVMQSQRIDPNSDEIKNQVMMRRMLASGGGGSKIPIILPGGKEINTYDSSEDARNAQWTKEPYEQEIKKKELADSDLQKLTQAQNILDLQGARKSQEQKRWQDAYDMSQKLKMKKDEVDPNSELSKSSRLGVDKFIDAQIGANKNTGHPALDRLVSQLEMAKKNSIYSGMNKNQIDQLSKNIENQIDNARSLAGIDVNKQIGVTKNVISIEGLGERRKHHLSQEELDKMEFEAKQEEKKDKSQQANKKLSDSNRKADMYTSAAINADKDMDEFSKGYDPTTQMQLANMPERLKSDARKRYESSKLAWLDNINYMRSGASMAKLETERADREFFPTIGDSPENVKIKRDRRRQFLEDTRRAYNLSNNNESPDASINKYSQKQESGINNLMNSSNISRDKAIELLKKHNKL